MFIIFVESKQNPQRPVAKRLEYVCMVCSLFFKKFEETEQVEDRRRSGRPKNKQTNSAADKQYLKSILLRNKNKSSIDLTKDLRDASNPAVYPSTIHWSLRNWRVVVNEQGEKNEVCKITQELDLKWLATGVIKANLTFLTQIVNKYIWRRSRER